MSALTFHRGESNEGLMAWGLSHPGKPFETSNEGNSEPPHGPKALQTSLPGRVLSGLSPELGKQQPEQFENLLLGFVQEMASLPIEGAELEMGLALKRVCEFFGLEWAALWRKSIEDPASLVPEHYFSGGGSQGQGLQIGVDRVNNDGPQTAAALTRSRAVYPWITSEVQRRKVIVFCQVHNLPAEAVQDKAGLLSLGIRSGVFIPFCCEKEVVGALSFGMTTGKRCWHESLLKRLQGVAGIFAQVVARKLSEERLRVGEARLRLAETEVRELNDRLRAKDDVLEPEFDPVQPRPHIVGRSPGIMKVLRQAEQVAPADCSVLITGATGTGKELIAQEIHRLSARNARAMVLVNCAALPSELVESELFGRERGAYTGALSSQIGRFESANGSTIFLDEIGDLPLGAQAKLLRVLQQGEFQRLGSPKTHMVDVRVIAATNRDLVKEVRKGKFREDLYYRLHVFPIELPSLHERSEDIPELVFAFLEQFTTRMGKKITKVRHKDMELLQSHRWPGNIRELRNVIEHSVIVTAGDILRLTLPTESPRQEAPAATLAEVEREHILQTLESTHWRIKGPYGAAARLDMRSSTLYSRMHKLGIPDRRQKDKILRDQKASCKTPTEGK